MKKFAVSMLPILWLTTAAAQQLPADDTGEVEEVRRYTVEVVIFRYTEDFGLGSEQFYPDGQPGDTEPDPATEGLGLVDEVQIEPSTRGMDLLTYAANADALHFERLAEAEFTMRDVLDRLERLDAYEPVMHFGWTQPTLPPEQTRPVDLAIFGQPPEGFSGTFTLYLSRYLHLVVDMALTAPGSEADASRDDARVPSFGDPVAAYVDPYAMADRPVYYRIQEDRIVKSGDVRYFDHPKFGIVAKITRIEKPDSSANPDAGLLGGSRQ